MPDLLQEQRDYISSTWKLKSEGVQRAQSQVTNWLFTVHGGGMAGLLTYAASRDASCSVQIGLGMFSAGLLLIVIYGIWMFYQQGKYFRRYRENAEELLSGAIEWPKFIERLKAQPVRFIGCEVIAWLSFVSAIGGVAALVTAVL